MKPYRLLKKTIIISKYANIVYLSDIKKQKSLGQKS